MTTDVRLQDIRCVYRPGTHTKKKGVALVDNHQDILEQAANNGQIAVAFVQSIMRFSNSEEYVFDINVALRRGMLRADVVEEPRQGPCRIWENHQTFTRQTWSPWYALGLVGENVPLAAEFVTAYDCASFGARASIPFSANEGLKRRPRVSLMSRNNSWQESYAAMPEADVLVAWLPLYQAALLKIREELFPDGTVI
jgi:hypothetical protein